MISSFGWVTLTLLCGYLALFFWGTRHASQATGRQVWLFSRARGRDRWIAHGFRAAFALAIFGPLLWLLLPALSAPDPLWTDGKYIALGVVGVLLAAAGAMLAFAAQWTMGRSWRVGVAADATGDLVSSGLFQFSRNPTFLGQLALLAGVAFAVPCVPTILAPLIFFWSATTQVRAEEAALRQALGADYDAYAQGVPRWIGLRRRSAQ